MYLWYSIQAVFLLKFSSNCSMEVLKLLICITYVATTAAHIVITKIMVIVKT